VKKYTLPDNGLYVTSLPVSEVNNQPNITSNMNIGLIDPRDRPKDFTFNQYDANNHHVEEKLEQQISDENRSCAKRS